MIAAQDGDDRGFAGEGGAGDRPADDRGVVGEGDLDQPRQAAFEAQDLDELADAHRLLDQRGDQVGVDTKRSTPQFSVNIHSFFGWLTRAMTRGIPNSCLASSETTRLSSSSPVAATSTSHVLEPGLAERRDLAGVADVPLDARRRAWPRSTTASVLLDEQDLVAGVMQGSGDVLPDVAGSGDRDSHGRGT